MRINNPDSETVEECGFLKSEIDRLTAENDRFRSEMYQMHTQMSPSSQVIISFLFFVDSPVFFLNLNISALSFVAIALFDLNEKYE